MAARVQQTIPSPEDIANFLKNKKEGNSMPIPKDVHEAIVGSTVNKQVSALESKLNKAIQTLSNRKNAKELQEAMFLLFQKHDFSPIEELIAYVIDWRDVPEKEPQRIELLTKMLEYTIPKLKSVEVSGEVEHKHTISIVRYGDDGEVKREDVKLSKKEQVNLTKPDPIDVEVVA